MFCERFTVIYEFVFFSNRIWSYLIQKRMLRDITLMDRHKLVYSINKAHSALAANQNIQLHAWPIRIETSDNMVSLRANQQEAGLRRSAVSCSCFASLSPVFSSILWVVDLQNKRTETELESISSGEKRRLCLERSLYTSLGPHFSQIGAVFRRHRAKRCSRSQASKPGWREGRRSLGIGMETGEGAGGPGGPGGPDGPGPRFGCASFNQDST